MSLVQVQSGALSSILQCHLFHSKTAKWSLKHLNIMFKNLRKITALLPLSVHSKHSLTGLNWSTSNMKINLWYCESMKQWRWILTDDSRPILKQESGQQPFLRDAMNDVANTVEYMLECKQG